MHLNQIEKIRQQLKQDFIGIDYVVDQVIDSIVTWNNTDKMRTPNIICLWGMTGCGKTQLIREIIKRFKLLHSYYFNMANINTLESIFDSLEDNDNMSNKSVFVFDEFQMCNTIDPKKDVYIERPNLKDLWGLLDSGIVLQKTVPVASYTRRQMVDEFYYIHKHKLLKWTVEKVEKSKKHNDNVYEIVDFSNYDRALRFMDTHTDHKHYVLRDKFRDRTMGYMMNFYENVFSQNVQKEYDFSKSLIFILGNLDLLYTDAENVESEIDPDIMYEKYKKIKFQDGKNALLKLFRPEQISRFGNNHVFYNAFSRQQYYDLIRLHLQKINTYYDVDYDYDDSLVELIYNEGVFPTQGVRPIISTIKYIIEANIYKIQQLFPKRKRFNLKYDKGYILINDKEKIKIILVNTVLDLDRNDTFKRICVHEAGHAWVCYQLYGDAPDNVVVKTNTMDPNGFVEKVTDGYYTKKELENRVCLGLGGLCAEHIVYGEHNTGSEDDLKNITSVINFLTHTFGMNNTLQHTKFTNDDSDFHEQDTSAYCEQYLQKAKKKTTELLKKDMKNYKKLVKILYDKAKITRDDFNKVFPPTKKKETDKFNKFMGLKA